MNVTNELHRDDQASKFGMWLFLFTEMLLFGGLFIVYSVLRYRNAEAFHLAAHELSVIIGTVNTIILLVSSATIAMSITAVRKQDKKLALLLLGVTVILGIAFLINKYFEWGEHITEHIYPGSSLLARRGPGGCSLLRIILFHDRPSCASYNYRTCLYRVCNGRHYTRTDKLRRLCIARELRIILASCRYDLDLPVSIVLSYYMISMEKTENKDHIVPYRTFLYVLALLIGLTLVSVALTQIYLGLPDGGAGSYNSCRQVIVRPADLYAPQV